MHQGRAKRPLEGRQGQNIAESREFGDIKHAIQESSSISLVMMNESLNSDRDLREALKSHHGKTPTKGIVAKWVRANKVEGAVSGSNDALIERRVRAQHVLEKQKLVDCKALLKAELGITPSLSALAEEEKALYKEIFMNDMLESQEISKPLKTIEENIENESPINEKTKPSGQDQFAFSKKTTLFETPQAVERPSTKTSDNNSLLKACEVVKVERVLFGTDTNVTPCSPRSMEDIANHEDNLSSYAPKTEKQPVSSITPMAKEDGQQQIANTLSKLEFLVKNEIDICEERTRMVETIDTFKQLLRNYQENSKLELLRSQMKSQDHGRNDCISIERPHREVFPENDLGKLVSGIKRIRVETPETFKTLQDRGSDLYRKREPLQHLPTNFSPYQPISIFPQPVHHTVIVSSQKPRMEPRSIDISVLKKHNFSVDLISAFH